MMQELRANQTGHFKDRNREGGDEGCRRMGKSEFARNASALKGPDQGSHMAKGSIELLLMDDLNADKLSNMTLKQIKELKQQKMEELYNMTPNEINALRESRIQKQNNMTLGEFRAQNHELIQLARLLGFDCAKYSSMDETMSCRGKESRGFDQMNPNEAVSRR